MDFQIIFFSAVLMLVASATFMSISSRCGVKYETVVLNSFLCQVYFGFLKGTYHHFSCVDILFFILI
jgi:hypothetical protein